VFFLSLGLVIKKPAHLALFSAPFIVGYGVAGFCGFKV